MVIMLESGDIVSATEGDAVFTASKNGDTSCKCPLCVHLKRSHYFTLGEHAVKDIYSFCVCLVSNEINQVKQCPFIYSTHCFCCQRFRIYSLLQCWDKFISYSVKACPNKTVNTPMTGVDLLSYRLTLIETNSGSLLPSAV